MWINGMMTQNSFTIYECVLQGRLLGNYVLLENMQGVLSRSQLLYMLRFSHISSAHKILVYSITWGVSMPLQNGTDLWLCQVPKLLITMTQDLTALDSSGCAVSVWKHLYVTLVKFHNTHATSNVVLKKKT